MGRENLGDYSDITADAQSAGLTPGIASGGGVDSRNRGLRGKDAARFAEKWGKALNGLDAKKCGWLADPNCLELGSRMIEETFHNFQLTSRPPSHLAPPFNALTVLGFGTVLVNSVFPNYTPLFTFITPPDSRGVIHEIGQSLPAPGLFNSISWRIALNGNSLSTIQPLPPYTDIRQQLWPPTGGELCVPIKLRGNQRFTLLAAVVAPLPPPVFVTFKVCGWTYQVRAETGDTIKSTLVD